MYRRGVKDPERLEKMFCPGVGPKDYTVFKLKFLILLSLKWCSYLIMKVNIKSCDAYSLTVSLKYHAIYIGIATNF